MASKQLQKDQTVLYANVKYDVVFSNNTTTKLVKSGEKIKHFETKDPDSGEIQKVETNTIYCDTDSMLLRTLPSEVEQPAEVEHE